MNAISATRRTIRREWTWFGTLLIISVGLMGVSDTQPVQRLQSAVNTAMSPIETTMNSIADTADSYWSALIQLDHLRTENQRLQLENQTLQEQLLRQPAISQLSTDWTAITAAQQAIPYRTTAARVIVRDVSDVSRKTIIINKGSQDGLQVGECVVDAGGALVGRLDSVYGNVSVVLLVNDPNAIVVGEEAKSGATGTIRGSISGDLSMQYVDASTPLTNGQAVVTAGEALPNPAQPSAQPSSQAGGVDNSINPIGRSPYPPGLLIGTITSVKQDPNAVVQSATIKPAAHLADATFVLVILDYQGGFASPAPGATPFVPVTPAPSGSVASAAPEATPKPTPTPTATPKPTPTPAPIPSYGY
jgi:rod shape-determining protein MreC